MVRGGGTLIQDYPHRSHRPTQRNNGHPARFGRPDRSVQRGSLTALVCATDARKVQAKLEPTGAK